MVDYILDMKMLPFKLSFVTFCTIIRLFFLGAHPHGMKVDLLTKLAETKAMDPPLLPALAW